MGQINIDPAEVRKAANQLRDCASRLNERLSTFNQIEEEISSSWKSQYTSQYLDCLESTEDDLRRSNRSINTIAGQLDGIAKAVEKAEAELNSIMSGGGSSGGGGGAFGGNGGGMGFR